MIIVRITDSADYAENTDKQTKQPPRYRSFSKPNTQNHLRPDQYLRSRGAICL